jgi:hypothetical protein
MLSHASKRIDIEVTGHKYGEYRVETVRGSHWVTTATEGGRLLDVWAWRRADTDDGWETYRVASYQPGTWRSCVFNASLG